jgi:hypothetical protein
VAEQGHKKYITLMVNRLDCLQAEPGVTFNLVRLPLGTVRKVHGVIPHAIGRCLRVDGRFVLLAVDVDGSFGKVGEAAGMVNIEVRGHDMPHVSRREPERLNACKSRFSWIALGARNVAEQETETSDVSDVIGSDAGVDQDEAIVRLNHQAMANETATLKRASLPIDELCADGTHGEGIDVVDA